MYINGAILHSFVYLAILLVRIQLLSLAPTVCLVQGADCLLLLLGFSSPSRPGETIEHVRTYVLTYVRTCVRVLEPINRYNRTVVTICRLQHFEQ